MCNFKGEIADKFETSYQEYKKWDISVDENGLEGYAENDSVSYLSGDAEESLETLDDNGVYIIGGIVDRNRHKVRGNN